MRALIACAIVLCASGCRQIAGLNDPIAEGTDGGGSAIDGPPGGACFGNQPIVGQICLAHVPSGDLQLAGPSLSTDNQPPCLGPGDIVSGGAGDCVIAAGTIEVLAGTTAKFTGSRPLVLIAPGAITISGVLDASSVQASRGPGADDASCASGVAPTQDGGAAGGSFAAAGGAGGTGNPGNPGNPGAALTPVTSLHGGCPGGNAGSMTGGAGGGAIYLLSTTSIAIDASAQLLANGDGGGHGGDDTGGGGPGGGSGGMIGLEAPTIHVASGGGVCADGGGGAGGSAGGGATGHAPVGCGAGAGGNVGGPGNGGGGGAGAAVSGSDGASGTYGGGGGGSVGVIKAFGTLTADGTLSPAPG